MKSGIETDVRASFLARIWGLFLSLFMMLGSSLILGLKNVKKLGQDDPRRIAHALKVALALTLVSLFYYFRPLYDGVGGSSIWAVLTVVVVFEYTVGATLSKCINRGLATLAAGFIAVGVHYLAALSGEKGEPVILGISVFLLAAGSTFARFFPGIKAKYDYGMLIFILTFSLVAVSSYRVDKLFELAHQRLSTIAIGCSLCVIISMFVCPVWAGGDLHKLIAINMEKLAESLEGFVDDYFKDKVEGESVVVKEEKPFVQGYKSVINSKSTEESLANFARWEPGHGRFGFRHPWKQYLKIGTMIRHSGFCIEALNATTSSEIQASEDFRRRIQPACLKMSSETSKALAEMAAGIRNMTTPPTIQCLLVGAKTAIDDLKTALKITSGEENYNHLINILPTATIASLIEIVARTEKLAAAVEELSMLAGFNSVSYGKPVSTHCAAVKPVSDTEDPLPHVVITVLEPKMPEIPISEKQIRAPHLSL